jgi:tetratricopeptide (TPR) repeat protein
MKFFDGLYPYEIVLLVLGVLLFLVLIIAFVVFLVRKQPYGKLLVFFAIPIIMIGFPGVKSFEISADAIKIEKEAQALEKDPTNNAVRASLEQTVANVSARPITDPHASTSIARAQLALGNDSAAETRIGRVLKEAPQLPAALELKKRIELDRRLSALTSQVEQNPNNAAAKAELAGAVRELDKFQIVNPKTMVNVAQAQKVLGDQNKALANVDKALKINPNLVPAIQLKSQLKISTVPPGSDNH